MPRIKKKHPSHLVRTFLSRLRHLAALSSSPSMIPKVVFAGRGAVAKSGKSIQAVEGQSFAFHRISSILAFGWAICYLAELVAVSSPCFFVIVPVR